MNECPSADLLRRYYASLSRESGSGLEFDLELVEAHLNQPCDKCNAYIAHHLEKSRDRDLNSAWLGLVQPLGPAPPSIEEDRKHLGNGTKPLGLARVEFASSFALSFASPTPPTVSEVKAALGEHHPYQVQQLLGSGGMGAVYLAVQRSMDRPVALKVIRRELARQASLVRRFQHEVKAAAMLSPHPNIVAAYDAGQAGEIYFLVMEYVDGIDLGRLVQEQGRLPADRACRYAMKAAEGLQYIHNHAMVHRDIKPQNLMRTRDDDIKILDLGLARFAAGVWSTVTKDDSLLGAVDFLAPEQARAAHKAGIAADIYSLGCTLYFLLTGQPPFPGGTLVQKILAHEALAPSPLSAFRADLPHGLQGVLDRMMAKDPANRYQTPAEVARALAFFAKPAATTVPAVWNFPAGLIELAPIAGDKPSPVDRRRRLRPPVRMAAALLLGSAVVLGLGIVQRIHTDKGELIIETTVDDHSVDIVVQQGGNLVTITDLQSKRKIELRSGDYELKLGGKGAADLRLSTDTFTLKRGGQTIVKVRRVPPEPVAGRAPAAQFVGEVRRFVGHTGPVQSVAFSPDGRRALSGSGWPQGDRTLRLWDVSTGRALRRFVGHTDGVGCVAFSPDGRRALSGSLDTSVRLWDVETARELRRFDGHTDTVSSVAFAPDGRRALSASFDKSMRLWDVETARELRRFVGHTEWIFSMALSSDGRRAVSGSKDWTVRVWDVETGEVLRHIDGQTAVHCVAFAPDGRRVLSGGEDQTVRLWDVETGLELRRFGGHTAQIKSVVFAPDGRRVLSGGLDRTVRLWDADSGKELRRFAGHTDYIYSVAFSPDGRQALSAGGGRYVAPEFRPGSDFAIRLWALPAAGEAPKTADSEATGRKPP